MSGRQSERGAEKHSDAAIRAATGGSHGGRGYRYQDEVAAAVAAMGLVGDLTVKSISCEGVEDLTLVTDTGPTHAQVKSRRMHLKPRSVAQTARDIEGLLLRHADALDHDPHCTVAIVLESVAPELEPTGWQGTLAPKTASYRNLADCLGPLVDPTKLTRVRLVHAPRPRNDAVRRLSRGHGLLPAAAEVCVGMLRQKMADLADSNGEPNRALPAAVNATELQRLYELAIETVDSKALAQATRDGIVEPLDLVTPLEDPHFLFGVDAEPGHLAAGYLVPREAETRRIVNGLQERRSALVCGPSGAGKSSLTWLASAATADSVVWYRVRRLDSDAVTAVLRLARALRAGDGGMRVGFIVDDVGRVPGPWDELVAATAAKPGLYALGSVREEDLPLLRSTRRSSVVRPVLDEELARALYERLTTAELTAWSGWREAFERSDGLLMEYAHILTDGNQLAATIESQVHERLDDPDRHHELQVLRLVSLAASFRCTVRLDRLRKELGSSEEAMSAVLRRLYNEHLIRSASPGTVTGLHDLRSRAIVQASHSHGIPTLADTARRLLAILDGADLTVAVAAFLEPTADALDVLSALATQGPGDGGLLSLADVQGALSHRLRTQPDVAVLAASLHGLRTAAFRRTAHDWSAVMDTLGLPRTMRETAMTLAMSAASPDALPLDPRVLAAVRSLRSQPALEYRRGMEGVARMVLSASAQQAAVDDAELVLLSAADWSAVNSELARFAVTVAARLAHESSDERRRLLTAARAQSPATAEAVAGAMGGEAYLLAEYVNARPWLYDPARDQDGLDSVVTVKFLHIDTPTAASSHPLAAYGTDDIHEAVVTVCRDLLALQPSADIAAVVAMAPDQLPSGVGDFHVANKRIPRANLPDDSAIAWNRLRIASIAMLSGESSATVRLTAESDVLTRLAAALRALLDCWIRGAYVASAADPRFADAIHALEEADRLGDQLAAPVLPVTLGVLLTQVADPRRAVDLPPSSSTADISRAIARNLVPRLLQPEPQLMGLAAYSGVIQNDLKSLADRSDWKLIDNPPSAQLAELVGLMRDLHDILAEAAFSHDDSPLQRVHAAATGARPLNNAADMARRVADQRVQTDAVRLRDALAGALHGKRVRIQVISRGTEQRYGAAWPPHDIAVLVDAEDPIDVVQLLPRLQEALGATQSSTTQLTLLGALRGHLVSELTFRVFNESCFPQPDDTRHWQPAAAMPLTAGSSAAAVKEAISALATASALHLLRSKRQLQPTERALLHAAETISSARIAFLRERAHESNGQDLHDSALGSGNIFAAALAVIDNLQTDTAHEAELAEAQPQEASSNSTTPGSVAARLFQIGRGGNQELGAALFLVTLCLIVHDLDPEHAKKLADDWGL